MTDDISDDEDEAKTAPQESAFADAPAFAWSPALGGFSANQLSDLGLLSPPPPIGGVLGFGVDPQPSPSVGGILGPQDVSQSIGLPASPQPRWPFEAGFALLSSGYAPPPSAFDPSQTPGASRTGLLSPPPPIGGVLGQAADPESSLAFDQIPGSPDVSQFAVPAAPQSVSPFYTTLTPTPSATAAANLVSASPLPNPPPASFGQIISNPADGGSSLSSNLPAVSGGSVQSGPPQNLQLAQLSPDIIARTLHTGAVRCAMTCRDARAVYHGKANCSK